MSTVDLTRDASADLVPLGAGRWGFAERSALRLFWDRLRTDRVALAGLVLITLLIAAAVAAPLIVTLVGAPPPNQQSSAALDQFGSPSGPSAGHLLGVDPLGRDVFSRVLYGLRVSLLVAVAATGLAVAAGVVLGLVAGYYRGWPDTLISRLMDIQLAFPILLLGLGLASACSFSDRGCLGGLIQPGLATVVFVIALAAWPYIGRIVRGQVLSLREKEFVEAARAAGASDARIVFGEILPNLVAPIVVYATLVVPGNVLFEAALSFLGVGVSPPEPSLGQMISDAIGVFDTAWWYMLFPGLALLMLVLAFNLVGDGLHDALTSRGGR